MRVAGIITRDEFLAAFNEAKPNKIVLFIRKYFSLSTNPEDLWLKKTITIVLSVLFAIMFLMVVLDINGKILNSFAYPYISIIFGYVGLRFYGANKQNRMAESVCKKLNISVDEYII